MRSLVGYAVLGTGLLAGWYYMHPQIGEPVADAYRAVRPASPVAKPSLGSEPINSGANARVASADAVIAPSETRTFSPTSPLFSQVGVPHASAPKAATEAAAPAAWPTVVDPVVPRPTPVAQAATADGEDARRELVRSIQRELKRVGCFATEPTGWWGPATSRAMADFVGKSNATLPVDKPDVVHLALLRSAAAGTCGSSCGAGQVAQNGVCVAKTITARGPSAGKPATAKATGEWPAASVTAAIETGSIQPAAPRKEPLPGAMAIGGPRVEETPGQAEDVSPSLTNPQQPAPGNLTAAPVAKRPLPMPRAGIGEARKQPRAEQPRPARQARYGTRTVLDIFQHPLGR